MGIKTVPQPPNSADLAPCDFCLFPNLRGCCYETTEEMKEAVTKVIDTLTQEDFHGAFQMLLERYNKVQSAYYFTKSENSWIHIFPKGISTMWNAYSLVQDLNSGLQVYFLRRYPLYYERKDVYENMLLIICLFVNGIDTKVLLVILCNVRFLFVCKFAKTFGIVYPVMISVPKGLLKASAHKMDENATPWEREWTI